MLNILVIIVFGILAFRISKSVSTETAVFVEYRQSTALEELVFLFPVGPLVLFFGSSAGSPLVFLLAVACYLPAMILAYKLKKFFEKMRLDTAYGALEAASNAFATAVGGVIYVGAIFLFGLATALIVI